MRICVQTERERRGRDKKHSVCMYVCVCLCVYTKHHSATPESEYILGWGNISSVAMKTKYFQVHIPTPIFLYLRNVWQRKGLTCECVCVCVYGIYILSCKKFLSADNYFVQCNKHPKNSKQLIISPRLLSWLQARI